MRKTYYFVNYAICNDKILRDCRMFSYLKDAKKFAAGLSYNYQIVRIVDKLLSPYISREVSREVVCVA